MKEAAGPRTGMEFRGQRGNTRKKEQTKEKKKNGKIDKKRQTGQQ